MGLFWNCPKCVNFGCDAEPPEWKCRECGHKGPISEFADIFKNIEDVKWRIDILNKRIESMEKLLEANNVRKTDKLVEKGDSKLLRKEVDKGNGRKRANGL